MQSRRGRQPYVRGHMGISEAGIALFFIFAYLVVWVAWSSCSLGAYDLNTPSNEVSRDLSGLQKASEVADAACQHPICCGAGLQNWQCVAEPRNRTSDDIVGKRGRVLYDGTIPEGGTVCPQAGGPSRLPMDLGNLRYLRAYTLLDREGVMHTRPHWG